MSQSADPNNGKVSMAVLKNEIGHLTEAVQALQKEVRGWTTMCDSRVRELEQYREGSEERWAGHKELHKTERGVLGVASLIGNAIAGVVGIFVNK